MQTLILQESNYKEEMQTIVEPYLVSIGTEFYLERHAGRRSTVCIMFRRTHMRL